MKSDYRFAGRPWWLLGHIVAIGAMVLFVNLGMWQLRRHDEHAAIDARLTARMEQDPLPIAEAFGLPADDIEFRRVSVTGTFDSSGEMVLLARSFRGRSGHNVLTPIIFDSGRGVIVNRGWVPIDIEGPPVVGAEPPSGDVTIIGVARSSESRRGLGPADPQGRVDRVSRVDLDRISPQFGYELAPFYVQLLSPEPEAGFPLVLEPPRPGEGPPNMSYAIQWFAFTAVVGVGYPILLRATARKASISD